jgi:hypothetical protein
VNISKIARMIAVAAGLGFFALLPARALAHCDGLDGVIYSRWPFTNASATNLAK